VDNLDRIRATVELNRLMVGACKVSVAAAKLSLKPDKARPPKRFGFMASLSLKSKPVSFWSIAKHLPLVIHCTLADKRVSFDAS
jgi:hypothetical protein